MNPYERLVKGYARLAKQGRKLPPGGFRSAPSATLAADASVALIFSPHPDDECITGGLALRLRREAGMKVINVAVTLGSNKSRRGARLKELKGACDYLGFGLLLATKNGLENINLKTRERQKAAWAKSVKMIAAILASVKPGVILIPHEKDRHLAHIGTHFLVLDALKCLPKSFNCYVVETEYWGAMETPNLMVESSTRDVADLATALSFHAGEVRRNPYHLLLPAWMQDNVRRGSEIVGERGGNAADFGFATLYRLRLWSQGRFHEVLKNGKIISSKSNAGKVLAGTQG